MQALWLSWSKCLSSKQEILGSTPSSASPSSYNAIISGANFKPIFLVSHHNSSTHIGSTHSAIRAGLCGAMDSALDF